MGGLYSLVSRLSRASPSPDGEVRDESEDAMTYPPGPQPGPYGMPVARPTNSKATASLVTGITSLVLSWCCGLGIAGIVAIVLGVKARREIQDSNGTEQGDGIAVAGIITGAIAVVLGVLILVVIGLAIIAGARFDTNGPAVGAGLS